MSTEWEAPSIVFSFHLQFLTSIELFRWKCETYLQILNLSQESIIPKAIIKLYCLSVNALWKFIYYGDLKPYLEKR